MTWYNKIFDLFGHRRLMTHGEFWIQVRKEIGQGSFRVIPRRQHELLLDIAATANVIVGDVEIYNKLRDSEKRPFKEAVQRLHSALMSYKIVEQDENPPPSTNAHKELHLMDIPG